MHIEQLMGHWSKANPSYWFPCRDWRAVITVITYGLPEYERQGWIQTHEFIVWPLQLLVGQNFHTFHTLSTQCERKETEKLKAEMLNRFWVTLGWSWSRDWCQQTAVLEQGKYMADIWRSGKQGVFLVWMRAIPLWLDDPDTPCFFFFCLSLHVPVYSWEC